MSGEYSVSCCFFSGAYLRNIRWRSRVTRDLIKYVLSRRSVSRPRRVAFHTEESILGLPSELNTTRGACPSHIAWLMYSMAHLQSGPLLTHLTPRALLCPPLVV